MSIELQNSPDIVAAKVYKLITYVVSKLSRATSVNNGVLGHGIIGGRKMVVNKNTEGYRLDVHHELNKTIFEFSPQGKFIKAFNQSGIHGNVEVFDQASDITPLLEIAKLIEEYLLEKEHQFDPVITGIRGQVQEIARDTVETISGKNAYEQYVFSFVNSESLFPNSHGEENPDTKLSQDQFEAKATIKGYEFKEVLDPKKNDYIDQQQMNLGHKLHLNVRAENASTVSKYLCKSGYKHKFFEGGEPDDGKIFTVYVGSHNLAFRLAQQISKDLNGLLCKPIVKGEIEYAPNVAGRFDSEWEKNNGMDRADTTFVRYPSGRNLDGKSHIGVNGISELRDNYFLVQNAKKGHVDNAKRHAIQSFTVSYKALSDLYGAYFHGLPALEKLTALPDKIQNPNIGEVVRFPYSEPFSVKVNGRILKFEINDGVIFIDGKRHAKSVVLQKDFPAKIDKSFYSRFTVAEDEIEFFRLGSLYNIEFIG